MVKKQEAKPTKEEEGLVVALLYDTLLHSQPLIAHNVREALSALLTTIGRPKLAELANTR